MKKTELLKLLEQVPDDGEIVFEYHPNGLLWPQLKLMYVKCTFPYKTGWLKGCGYVASKAKRKFWVARLISDAKST